MAYKIIFHPLAGKEYSEAFNWYEEKLSGLGIRFENVIDDVLQIIAKNPVLYPKKKGHYHEANVSTFPYLIVYRAYPRKKIVLIAAIHHTSRNPRKKYRR